jgi:hypothetical protein
MIDTVRLVLRVAFVTRAELLALGFRLKETQPFKTIWVKNPRGSAYQPKLTCIQTNNGNAWLCVEVSLPKLLFGRNTVTLREHDIPEALNRLSSFIYESIGMEFEALTAIVSRIDYFFDFPVGEANLSRYLAAASKAVLPYTRRHIVENSVSFESKSKRVVIYDKYAEVSTRRGLVNAEEIEESKGKMRLELRYLISRACKKIQTKHGLLFPTAQYLCSLPIARKELSSTLADLGLDREIVTNGSRIDRLREVYGDKRSIRPLVTFITLLETYGEKFWRLNIAGYSKSTYQEHLRLVKNANALLSAETTLPPLQLPPEAFILRAA